MNKLDNFTTEELLKELLFRIENDRDSYIECLQGYSSEELTRITQLLAPDTKFELLTFLTNDYKGVNIDRDVLDKTDKEVMCSSLIYGNPIKSVSSFKHDDLRRISIFDAKKLLQQTRINRKSGVEENALVSCIGCFGIKDAIKIRDAINFYEQQVVRQALDVSDLTTNLFTLNEEEKKDIVREQYHEIVDYFVNNAANCIWGELTKSAKSRLCYSISGSGYSNERVRANFTKVIADYMTLGELQEGVVKTKTLDRLIVTKNN